MLFVDLQNLRSITRRKAKLFLRLSQAIGQMQLLPKKEWWKNFSSAHLRRDARAALQEHVEPIWKASSVEGVLLGIIVMVRAVSRVKDLR
jgi:hypothetical protein